MKDTPPEIERMQVELMISFSPEKRIALGCEMFMAARELIIASLPENLSEREFKKQYYQKMYGEPLPADFFRDEE